MRILYIHGYCSAGQDGTSGVLRKLLPKHEIISPDVPVDPLEAKVRLNGKQGWIDNNGKFTIQKEEAAYSSWHDYSK